MARSGSAAVRVAVKLLQQHECRLHGSCMSTFKNK